MLHVRHSLGPPAVSDALEQILFFTNPADCINCLIIHSDLHAVARKRLHYRLAAPHHGVLLMKWSLCFDNAPWTGQFLALMRKNLSILHADENVPVQTFMNAYEAMTLNEIFSSIQLYSNLTTLILDFTIYRSLDTSTFCSSTGADLESLLRAPNAVDAWLRRPTTRQLWLLFSWQQWARAITAVADACSSSLRHFMFIAALQPPATLPSSRETFELDWQVQLPNEFLVALRLDAKLAHMQNLQTLHMPAMSKYEAAFKHTVLEFAEQVAPTPWQALHALPEAERLPNLKCLVIDNCRQLIGKDSRFANGLEGTCTLPDFATNNVVIQELLPNTASADALHHTVFPNARYLYDVQIPQPLGRLLFNPEARYLNRARVSWNNLSLILPEQLSDFMVKVVAPIYDDTYNVLRDARFERFLDNPRLHCSGASFSPLVIPTFTIAIDLDTISGFEASTGLPKLYDLLSAYTCVRSSLVRLKIELNSAEVDNYFAMRGLLSTFAMKNGNNDDTALLSYIRLSFKTTCTTLGAWAGEYEKRMKGCERLLPMQKYNFPRIEVCFQLRIMLESFVVDCKNDPYGFENIDEVIVQSVKTFARCAIDSCKRRDLSFYLHQSLKHCNFRFEVRLPLMCTYKTDGIYSAVRDKTPAKINSAFAQGLNEALEFRCKEILDSRVLHAAFAESFDYVKVCAGGIGKKSEWVLPLPVLKTVKVSHITTIIHPDAYEYPRHPMLDLLMNIPLP